MDTRAFSTRFWKAVFIGLVAVGAYATFVRFAKGLGASTNLSDQFPWGLWIGFDILVGVGLAAGGFVIAATVHIFQLKQYSAISRPAILTAFLGYLLVIVALLFDLGRPYRIWHPIVMGNPHSVMFEVAICVMLYTAVLALEFSPLLFTRLGMTVPLKIVRGIYIPLVIVGVLLSTLHQSSLGTLYVIVPDKLHGLWYSPLLPVFFFLSAIAGGLAMTIFESFMSYRAFGKRLEQKLLSGVARVIVVILAVLLVLKLQNLTDRGNLHLIWQVTQESVMFWGEVLLGVALPMILFMIPRVRASQGGLFLGAMLTIMGFILNRLNVSITGMAGTSGVNYIPSWMEFAVTACIVAVGFVLFRLAVQHLDIFPDDTEMPADEEEFGAPAPSSQPVFQGRMLLALWGFLIAGFVVVSFSNMRNGASTSHANVASTSFAGIEAPELKLPDQVEMPIHEDSPGMVVFDHETHVDPNDPGCTTCHKGMFPIIAKASSGPDRPFDVDFHDSDRCGKCHNGDDAFDVEDDCADCHWEE